jgi:cation diffusion facilitator CzcD-associated flavoprotein CzcO
MTGSNSIRGKQFSHLPGRPYPKGTPTFPTCDQVADYFDRLARQDGIELRLGTEVERIAAPSGGWRLATSGGDIDARAVVVATGYEHTPYVPKWPGVHDFTGELLHSADQPPAACAVPAQECAPLA